MNPLHPRMKLWIERPHLEGGFGDGKLRLLVAIDELGSLREAADTLGISYRKAWGNLKKAESCLGFELLTRLRGGKGGGKSELTSEGVALILAYRKFQGACGRDVEKNFKRYFKVPK